MTINIKNYVIQELEAYPRILRQISVLRYEMEHPAHVSAQEMKFQRRFPQSYWNWSVKRAELNTMLGCWTAERPM